MELQEQRQLIADTCRQLQTRGLVVGTAGNVSIRVDNLVVISPSGVNYDEMTAEDVGIHRLDGSVYQASLAPSSELPLHLAVYAGSQHRSLIHTHAPASSALSTVVEMVPNTHYYSALFGGPIRVSPYSRFGTPELATNVAEAMVGRSAALMANHGAVIAGSNLIKTLTQVEYLEYVCEVALRALSTGRPLSSLSDQEIFESERAFGGYGQKSNG